MTTAGLALAAVLAVLAVLAVARPFLRTAGREERVEDRPGKERHERMRLAEERDRALGALKELEFDHRTGKVSDEDYQQLVGPLRREAVDEVGFADEDYFLFSEETDWCFRFREARWDVVFFPGAECVHVRGAAHGGRLYRENLRGHLLFLWKHRGPKTAERARRLLLGALRLRGVLFRGERGRVYREAAAWLSSGDAAALLER